MFGTLAGQEFAMIAFMIIGGLVVVAYPASRICGRIGFPAWMGILAVLPLVNIGLLWFVAFTEWTKAPGQHRSGESTTA